MLGVAVSEADAMPPDNVEYEMLSMVEEDQADNGPAPADYGATHDAERTEMALEDARVDALADLETEIEPANKKRKRKLKKRSQCCRADLMMIIPIEVDESHHISEPCKADIIHIVSDCCAAGLSVSVSTHSPANISAHLL